MIIGGDVNTVLSSGWEDSLGQSFNKESLTEMVGSKVVMKEVLKFLSRSAVVK